MKKFPSSKYTIIPITNEETYLRFCEWAEEISDLTFEDKKEEDIQIGYLDTITTLIEAYENKHFQFNKTELTLTQIIEQALDQLNLNKKDLAKILGSNRVSEIFSGKRQLSLSQIRKLHKELRIPTDILVGV
jgi:HTH-type transcriptional regulator / antitoxin HigA